MSLQEGEKLVHDLKDKGILKNPKTLQTLSQNIVKYLSDQVQKNNVVLSL